MYQKPSLHHQKQVYTIRNQINGFSWTCILILICEVMNRVERNSWLHTSGNTGVTGEDEADVEQSLKR